MIRSREAAAWHVTRWGPLGWIETGVKSCAFLCAYLALASSIATGWSTPRGVRIVELALIGTATVGLVAAIGDRLLERVMDGVTCGELVKIQFLCSTGLTVRNVPAATVIGLTAAYALVYALAALVWVWR